jgi:hypothetical protein
MYPLLHSTLGGAIITRTPAGDLHLPCSGMVRLMLGLSVVLLIAAVRDACSVVAHTSL